MNRSERFHGSVGATNNDLQAEAFEVYSLIDITATGLVAPYNSKFKQIIDDSDTIINNERSWNKSRNKQRNWETVVQVLGLRSFPNIVSTPITIFDDLSNYEFGSDYIGKENIWVFRFTTEQSGLFTGTNGPTEMLELDLHQVPITTNLDETVNINPAIIDTLSLTTRNLYTNIINL